MIIGIYKIQNLINGKVYIGQSVHIEKRWIEHCRPSNNSIIAQAIRQYGKENFSFQILEECSIEQLNERESFYIQQYNSIAPNGYNIVEYDTTNRINNYNNYDKNTLLKIVDDIKNTDLSFREIAEKYKLDVSMLYYLNRGDYHRLENENYPLRFLKNNKNTPKKHYYCVDCGVEITFKATRCVECSHKQTYRCEHPDRDTLKKLIRTESFVSIGNKFGVTDNTIKKWCKKYSLPFKKSDIKLYTDEEWELI